MTIRGKNDCRKGILERGEQGNGFSFNQEDRRVEGADININSGLQ